MRKKLVVVFLAVVLLLVPALVAVAAVQAQGTPTPGGCEHPSTSIALSASPTEIPADDVSTSEIKVVVSWPEESDIEGLAVDTLVDLFTTRGRLTDAENQSNSGSSISLITDNNGTVTALLSGNETGVAYVTSVVTLLGTCNKTTVTFVAPGATPTSAPSGDGDGDGNGAVTTPTPTPTAAVNVTPSPSPEATATPAVSVTPTVTTSPSPTEAPTPTASATATPEKRWQIPGFEAVFAIASLLSVAYLVMRRRKAQS